MWYKLTDILLVLVVFAMVAAVLAQLPVSKLRVCIPPNFPELCVLGR
jgi:hypothetical protein